MSKLQDNLCDLFELSETSLSGLVWKERPPCHFPTMKGYRCFNTRFANKPAGTLIKPKANSGSYWTIRRTANGILSKLTNERLVHRIIYTMVYGEIPASIEIDHRDGNSQNNRVSNLRAATRNQNQHNSRKPIGDFTSKLKGVSLRSPGKWRAQIALNGKVKHLGYYPTEQLAHAAYCEASLKLHGEFSRTK